MKPIRLVVADHSLFIREAVPRLLADEPRIAVVGRAASGEELLRNLSRWRPDVITLELSMPGADGLATIDRIMASRPTPVVVFSTHSAKDAQLTIEALHHGAVDFIDKQAYSLVDFQALREVLIEKILGTAGRKAQSEAGPSVAAGAAASPGTVPPSGAIPSGPEPGTYQIIVIGASTGGPPAIEQVLQGLGPGLGAPVVVVQHMPEGFTRAFAERLDKNLPLQVREAVHGERLRPDMVRIAPAGSHVEIWRNGGYIVSALTRSTGNEPHCPSVDVLFATTAESMGHRAVGVLLTGMGRDGAQGMAKLAAKGAHTIAQDEHSAAVYGMPRAAVELNAAREILPIGRIGKRLRELFGQAEAEG